MTEPTPTTSRSDSNVSSASSTSTPITALPTEEALQLLLSPDGYYKYLAISKEKQKGQGSRSASTTGRALAVMGGLNVLSIMIYAKEYQKNGRVVTTSGNIANGYHEVPINSSPPKWETGCTGYLDMLQFGPPSYVSLWLYQTLPLG